MSDKHEDYCGYSQGACTCAIASPQATRPERICGNCGLPLVQNETEEACRELDKISTRLEKARAVAPAQTRLTAEQFLSSRFEPDPNEPDEDTYWLRFPNGVECVENRAFWKKHLAELLEAFRDKSEAELRAKLAEQELTILKWELIAGANAARAQAAEAEVAALRERERWIPVEEKLPEESKCLYSFKADILMKRGDDWRSGTFQRGQFVDVKGWVQTQITHWKALSAAPERA